MLRVKKVPIADIYVPVERRKELDQKTADALAESILGGEEQHPIQVREGKGRYVLVKGIHRLEARRSLGDVTIDAFVVHAPRR